jgi:hypothetical protein
VHTSAEALTEFASDSHADANVCVVAVGLDSHIGHGSALGASAINLRIVLGRHLDDRRLPTFN